MPKARLALVGAVAISFAALSAPAAQQADNRNENRKKPPRQTHDKGVDAPDAAGQPTPATGERNVDAVSIVHRAGGSIMAMLDESYEDALIATVKPDGSIAYTCVHGLSAGAEHVAAPKTAVSVAPTLEEK